MPYRLLALIAAACALMLLLTLPDRYDVLLRAVVSAVALWGTVDAVGEGRVAWAVVLGLLAVLFNPFYVLPFGEGVWAVLEVGAAAGLAASARRVGTLLEPATDPAAPDQS